MLENVATKHGLIRDKQGLSTVEYVIILGLIAIVAIAAWRTLGENVEGVVNDANTELEGISAGSGGDSN
ncbi:MAG: Flp family type IVb pilin [Myxococcota bacterium]